MYATQPDIICLTETHVTPMIPENEIMIKNYQNVRTDSNSNRTGGVITYVKNNIKFKMINSSNSVINGVWMNTIEVCKNKIMICNLYRSPSSSISMFCNSFVKLIEDIQDRRKLIITGDFNIDININSFYSKRIVNELKYLGFDQRVESFTRSNFRSSTIIDLVFTNMNVNTKVLDKPKITDHNIVQIDIDNTHIEHNASNTYLTRNFKNFDKNAFHLSLKSKFNKLDIKYGCDDVCDIEKYNFIVNNITCNILDSLDEVAPIIQKNVKLNWRVKPWINDVIRTKIIERDGAFKMAKLTGFSTDIDKYRKLRNLVVNEIRNCKKKYYEEFIDRNKSKPDKLWSSLKELIGDKKKCESELLKEIHFEGEVYTDAKVCADKINNFFINNVQKIVEDIEMKNENEWDEFNNNNVSWESFKEITIAQVDKIIKNLDCKKGSKIEINAFVIRMVWETEKDTLMFVINNSLKLGIMPDILKISTVIPIQKIKSSYKAEDLRPINTLPIIEQIIEQLVKDQLEEYVDKKNILNEEQSGFRRSHSCETAIQNCIIDWRSSLDRGLLTGLLFVDLTKAFETIDRSKLIATLELMGIKGTVKQWFVSYLLNRKQKVKFRNAISKKLNIDHGVPQGSKLGPLLFILYINSVINIFKESGITCRLFADDMILYYSSRYYKNIENKLNNALKLLNSWLVQKQLKINIKKTVFMIIHDRRIKNVRGQCNINLDGKKILEVQKTKYLGIIIDDNLSLNDHAIYTIQKVTAKVNVLARLGNTVTSYTKSMIYKSIVAPHFEYCSTLMINYSQNYLDVLQKLQNRSMRMILGVNKYTKINLMLETLGWMSVWERVKYNTMIMVYKMVNNISPKYLQNKLTKSGDTHNYNTRNRSKLCINFTRTYTAEKSITYQGFKWFNDLPDQIKQELTVDRFKRSLKEYLKECKRD